MHLPIRLGTVVLAVLCTGCVCSTPRHTAAICAAVDAGQVEGLTAEDRFLFRWPDAVHAGPYSAIDRLDVEVQEGPHRGQRITFFVGLPHAGTDWEVFAVRVDQDGVWRPLAVRLPGR